MLFTSSITHKTHISYTNNSFINLVCLSNNVEMGTLVNMQKSRDLFNSSSVASEKLDRETQVMIT